MARLTTVCAFLLAFASTLHADQYWIAYEGNDFPENEGWLRGSAGGGDHRSLEDGTLLLDGLGDVRTDDYYERRRAEIDPQPGESFRAEWRFGIEQLTGISDPGLALYSDDSRGVGFSFSTTAIYSGFEGLTIPFDFEGMHEFVLTSPDMLTFELFADGNLLHRGDFVEVVSSSTLAWGDGVQGAASRSRWDFVRFGVVPEPESWPVLAAGLLTMAFRTTGGGPGGLYSSSALVTSMPVIVQTPPE